MSIVFIREPQGRLILTVMPGYMMNSRNVVLLVEEVSERGM